MLQWYLLPHIILIFFQYYLDPPVKLNEALERYGLKKDDFFVLRHGESRNLNTNDRFENWNSVSSL